MREFILQYPGPWLAAGGFVIGTAFGAIVFATNFCTMGSLSDILTFGDYRRFRAWLLAAATALAGTQLLSAAGIAPLERAMYLSPNLNWFGNILGGLMFGFGMVFAGGCASKNLARAGGGDLRSLMLLVVMALFAYMTLGGILGPVRSWLEQALSVDLRSWRLATQSLGEILGAALRIGPRGGDAAATLGCLAAAATYCFKDARFRTSRIHLLSGIAIGLCVVAGWALTGLAFDELADKPTAPQSLTFVRPSADAIEWLQRFTAAMMPGFGTATVFGTLCGAFLAATAMGRFKVATFSSVAETKRGLFGAALMGMGGVLALGCTIGQAITGVSTLALGSFLTAAALICGGLQGMKALERILMAE